MTAPLRVLGRIRLSRETDERGTSIERQRESIEQWSLMHGHTIVGWAVDSGLSGSVDPFQSPELGPWLQESQLGLWDALVAYRLDRLARRVIPLNALFGFVQQHGKTLASVSESLDLSTWIGRLVANVIAGVAEGELEAIRERNLGSQKKVRELGRWHGGWLPYGYRADKRDDGWYLCPDPDESRVLRDVVIPRILAHQSTNSVAGLLNELGIPTRRGGPWSGQALRAILRGRVLLGHTQLRGKLVTDENGMPLQRAEPILTHDEYARLQLALDARSIRAAEKTVNPLAGVLWCFECGSQMYLQKLADRDYDYFRCSNRAVCKCSSIRADAVYSDIEEMFLSEIGELERRERVYIHGSDHAEELAAVTAAIESTRKEKDLGLYDGDEESYLARLERLTTRKREMEQLPSSPSGFQFKPVGETYGQAWKRMDIAERRSLMFDSGIRVSISRTSGDMIRSGIEVPENMRSEIERKT